MSSNRREFLRTTILTAAGATAASVPTFVSRSVLGATKSGAAPSDRVRLGFIGVGNRGGQNLEEFLERKDLAEVVALCDVDSNYLANAVRKMKAWTDRPVQTFGDYRKLLESKDIDAVVISTPDHWHALATIDACNAGKDVYCEKPLTLTIAEGQAMVAAARANKRIVQTGSQQRSDERFRRACELVRSGRVGKVHTVRVGISGNNFGEKVKLSDRKDVPEELNYDLWLGPAPYRPYNPNHVHYNFRFFWDYSGGQMTNWGAHHLDIAQWGLGMDESGPISAVGKAKYNKGAQYEVPDWCEVTYQYADGTTVICGQGQPGGTTFEGEQGKIHVTRDELVVTPEDIGAETLGDSDVHLYKSDDHYRNWIDCIHSRKLPICDVAIGHRSATVCHLGNIAIRSGKKVNWDPEKEIITGDDELAKMASRPYRAPWSLPTTS
jgi:predicted dehydrogenase